MNPNHPQPWNKIIKFLDKCCRYGPKGFSVLISHAPTTAIFTCDDNSYIARASSIIIDSYGHNIKVVGDIGELEDDPSLVVCFVEKSEADKYDPEIEFNSEHRYFGDLVGNSARHKCGLALIYRGTAYIVTPKSLERMKDLMPYYCPRVVNRDLALGAFQN